MGINSTKLCMEGLGMSLFRLRPFLLILNQFVSRPIASEALCLHMNFNEPNEETLCNTLKSLLLKHCAQRVQA